MRDTNLETSGVEMVAEANAIVREVHGSVCQQQSHVISEVGRVIGFRILNVICGLNKRHDGWKKKAKFEWDK